LQVLLIRRSGSDSSAPFSKMSHSGCAQLVDVSCRALSPAINDPYTAVQAIDHLTVIFCAGGFLTRTRCGGSDRIPATGNWLRPRNDWRGVRTDSSARHEVPGRHYGKLVRVGRHDLGQHRSPSATWVPVTAIAVRGAKPGRAVDTDAHLRSFRATLRSWKCRSAVVHGREKVPTGGQVAVPAGGR
jgi:hypothetical protein